MIDALDVMSNLDKVLPYYQAIFSADEHTVIGYEVVGRIQTEEGIQSLASFFHDDSIPSEFQLEADNIYRKSFKSLFRKRSKIIIIYTSEC